MIIIYWVQCTLREGFVFGGLTQIYFWKSVKGGHRLSKKRFHIKTNYLTKEKCKKNVDLQHFFGFYGVKNFGTQNF